jgi:hypothetical protein
MIFRQLFERQSSTYTYLLADEDSREAILIESAKPCFDGCGCASQSCLWVG